MGRSLLLALYLFLFSFQSLETLREERAPRYDAQQYLTIAYNLAHHGAFSLDLDPSGKQPWPTAHRPPGYSVFLAIGMLAQPQLRTMELEQYFQEESQPRLRFFRLVQLTMLLVVSFLAMWIAWEISGSRPLCFLALGLVGLDSSLIQLTGDFLSENLALFLFTAFSLCIVLVVKRGHYALFGLAGILLAFLALTRPLYSYLWPPVVAFFIVLSRTPSFNRKLFRKGTGVFLVCYCPLVGFWMARNWMTFDRLMLSTGSGVVLDIRARLDRMNPSQYACSFLYWSNSWYLGKSLLPQFFDEGTVALLDDWNPEGAYRTAYARYSELLKENGSITADTMLAREALREIVSHPLRHLMVTVPIAYRGMQVNVTMLSLLMFASLFGAFWLGFLRRDMATLAALLPAVLSFLLHSAVTQNMPRFNVPLVPVLWISLLVTVWHLGAKTLISGQDTSGWTRVPGQTNGPTVQRN